MTEPLDDHTDLHDLLTRIADRAGPGPTDPGELWRSARQARRSRTQRRAVALVAAGLAAVAALTAVGIEAQRHEPPQPVEQPDPAPTGPAIPSVVYGVPGDGGLPVEPDLAVGRASVVIANPVGVYVVTAGDGEYHRVRLPGYDATSYSTALPGIALSPDGTQLAFGWRSTARHEDGRPLHSGLRVLSLATGAVWSAHFGEAFGVSDISTSTRGTYAGRRTAAGWVPAWRTARSAGRSTGTPCSSRRSGGWRARCGTPSSGPTRRCRSWCP